MPKFLEEKLKREYPNNPSAVYGTMNAIGAMRGNKETAKGREMEKKHEAHMKKPKMSVEPMREMRIEFHRGKGNKVTGATVHHHMMPKPSSKSAAFMEDTHHSFPFSADQHEEMMNHVDTHSAGQMGSEMAEGKAGAEDAGEEEAPEG